jgi:hypothetical protein
MKIKIPWVPPTLNQQLRSHWSKQRKLTRVAAGYILAEAGKKIPPEENRVSVEIIMHRKRTVDQDGLHGGCKPIFDALVRLGYAVDDAPKWMDQKVSMMVDSKNPPSTEITINGI